MKILVVRKVGDEWIEEIKEGPGPEPLTTMVNQCAEENLCGTEVTKKSELTHRDVRVVD